MEHLTRLNPPHALVPNTFATAGLCPHCNVEDLGPPNNLVMKDRGRVSSLVPSRSLSHHTRDTTTHHLDDTTHILPDPKNDARCESR